MVSQLTAVCLLHNLEINNNKTVELVMDFRKHPPSLSPLYMNNSAVQVMQSVKFIGTTITSDLRWERHSTKTIKRAHHRIFFLRLLCKMHISLRVCTQFYRATKSPHLIRHCVVYRVFCSHQKRQERIMRTSTFNRSLYGFCMRQDPG